jgi:hypothetical protein
MNVVLITKGKGEGNPDYVTIQIFNDLSSAHNFCKETEKPNDKYWTKCELIKTGDEIEVYHNPYQEV